MAPRKALFIALILLVTLPQPVLAIDEVVDNYTDETKVAGKHLVVRNTTFNAMELYFIIVGEIYEDYTLYTEVDPNNRITKNASHISFVHLDENVAAYVYGDYGADYFGAEWEHELAVMCTGGELPEAEEGFVAWGISNEIGTVPQSNHSVHLRWIRSGYPAIHQLRIIERDNNAVVEIDFEQGLSNDTWYYLTIKRWVNNTLHTHIYTDSARSIKLETLVITLDNGETFQYIYGLSADNRDHVQWIDGYVKNLTVVSGLKYENQGHFYTTDVLSGISYTATAILFNTTIPSKDSLTVEFSQDNSTWVDHNGIAGSDSIIAGYEAVDLRDLDYSTIYLRFNFTDGGLADSTPRLYQLRLVHEAPDGEVAVNVPAIIAITFNTTEAGDGCGVYASFSDAEGLDGYIFWNNATSAPGGVNSTFTGLAGVSDYTQENVTLPSSGTKFGVKYYVNDTDGNWAVDTLAMFPTIEIEGDIIQMGGSGIILFCIAIIIPIAFYMVKKR